MSNLDFVKARMGKRVRMTQIGDSQTNELPNLLCVCYLTLTPCPNCSFRQAPINSAWELLMRFLLHKRYYKKVENPALSLLTQHVSTNTVILYGRKLRLKRLKDSPHSGPQTKAANGKAEMNPPQNPPVSFYCMPGMADRHTGAGGDLPPPTLCCVQVHTRLCDGSFPVSIWLGYGAPRQSGRCYEDIFF